jgi:hypothetical protein
MTQKFCDLVLVIWCFFFRYALCPLRLFALSPTGLYTDTTDIMAEMEGFGKGSQLFVTSKMIEFFLTYLNCSCGAEG